MPTCNRKEKKRKEKEKKTIHSQKKRKEKKTTHSHHHHHHSITMIAMTRINVFFRNFKNLAYKWLLFIGSCIKSGNHP